MLPTALAAVVIAGCSAPTTRTSNTVSSETAIVTAEPTMSIEEVFGDMVQSRAEPRVPAAPTNRTGQSDSDRYATLIGLYGEQISDPHTDEERSRPGTANIAQVSFAVDGACFDPAINRQGTHLAFASTMHRHASDIYVKSVTGTTVTQVTSDAGDDVMPTFHPDGERIAFASNRAGKWDIYVTSISGGPPVQITNDPDQEIHPTFSPDGSMLAYCKFSSQSGRWEIWAVELENPGVRRFLEYGMFPKWSPDIASNKILFQRPRQRGSRLHGIWTIDYVNGEAVHPTEIVSAANAAVINPSWSPDGQRITFVSILDPDGSPSARPEQSDVWVINIDGSGRTKLTDSQFANFQPIWATDGRVYFVSNRSGVDNIWAVSTDRAVNLSRPAVAGADASRNR